VSRVMTMGELTASIAHEVNQPSGRDMTNGDACLNWLSGRPRSGKRRVPRGAHHPRGKRGSEVIGRSVRW